MQMPVLPLFSSGVKWFLMVDLDSLSDQILLLVIHIASGCLNMVVLIGPLFHT